MKTFVIVLGTAALAAVLVAAGTWLGVAWTRGRVASGHGMMMESAWEEAGCRQGREGLAMPGMGMMNGDWDDMPCSAPYAAQGEYDVGSLADAQAAVEGYVGRLGYEDLHVTEVMEFERNYYAIAAEDRTGVGAMELLVDKASGAVGPEPGPNMMWNAQYGMMSHSPMMGTYPSDEMTLSPEEARDTAQRWLDANLTGRTAGEADPFYGYYTVHFLDGKEIEGMLSVHGSSGDVWYHSWHGDFIAMAGDHD